MATVVDEPPPLIDAAQGAVENGLENLDPESLLIDEEEADENEAWLDDEDINDDSEGEDELPITIDDIEDEPIVDQDDDDEEDIDEEEDEYDEDEFDEDEYGEDYEDEEEEEDDDDDDDDEDELKLDPFAYKRSEEGFQESDLEERKKRRYLIGVHSFYDLADPHLEDALEPIDAAKEEEGLTVEEKVKRGLKAEKQFYKDICAELGVKPDPKVLASLREQKMDLTGMGMNAKEIVAVCKLLMRNNHVEYVSFAGNSAGGEGGLAIAELIANNEKITGYNLASTEILEVFDAICQALSQNPGIMHLDFSKNELEDIDMPHLKKVLRECQFLQTLKLNANFIRDDGLRHIGLGLRGNQSLELIDLSHNKILGDKKAAVFFTACGEHLMLRNISLRRNFIRDEGGKGVGRILGNNPRIEELDMSFNLMEDASAQAIGRGLGRFKERQLRILKLELQCWRQESGATILKPLGNSNLEMPIELVDFGMMLDIHTAFIDAMKRAQKAHPDLKVIHGQTYGLEHAKGPNHKALVIRKADAVCKSFETPLVMLMEELAKEKKELTVAEFRKFIKQCNLYKDKALTEAFENVFEKPGTGHVDAEALLEAFDTEYPGLRVIPEPDDEEEEEEEKPKPEKKKKGKGKGGKGKGGGAAKGKGKGKKK